MDSFMPPAFYKIHIKTLPAHTLWAAPLCICIGSGKNRNKTGSILCFDTTEIFLQRCQCCCIRTLYGAY